MVLSISANKSRHRFDSLTAPVFTGSGWATLPKWFVRNHLYQFSGSPFTWAAPNRTDLATVALRDVAFSNWTLSANITRDGGINKFTKTGTDSFAGATGSGIGAGNCSIEGVPVDLSSTNTLALQSGTANFNFGNAEIEHALVFSQNGLGLIYELGVPKLHESFSWHVGDRGLVELYGNIVRYYLIKPTGAMILLRSTRSKLAYPVIPTVGVYHAGGAMSDVLVWSGAEATAALQNYGVLKDFQDWQNKATFESLAEKTVNKDKSEDFTYFTRQKYLKSLSLSVAWDEGEKYREFLEFYKWHDAAREFIFADAARGDEFFARFASGFSDAPLGAGTFGMAADIRQMINAPSLIGL